MALRQFRQRNPGITQEPNETAFAETWADYFTDSVAPCTVLAAAYGKTWRDVPGALVRPGQRGARHRPKPQLRTRRFDADTVREIRALRAEGHAYRRLAKRFGVDVAVIFKIVRRTIYADVQ
jgi:hypothetical protein